MERVRITKGAEVGSRIVLQMALCSFLWAGAFLLLKIVGTSLSPFALTALRGLMGSLLLAGWLRLLGQGIRPRGREWRDWAILGFLQGIIPNTLTAYALTQIAAGLTSMIQATTPLIVAVLAQIFFTDERLTRRRAVGLAIGFGGMAMLVGPAAFGTSTVNANGVAAMLAVAISYALGNLYIKSIPSPQPLRLAYGQQLFSGIPTFMGVTAISGVVAFAGAADSALALVVLGIFGTALPIVLYMRIVHIAGPTVGSMNGYLLPPWTILLGVVVLGETLSLREVTATGVVLAGVIAISTKAGSFRRLSDAIYARPTVRPL